MHVSGKVPHSLFFCLCFFFSVWSVLVLNASLISYFFALHHFSFSLAPQFLNLKPLTLFPCSGFSDIAKLLIAHGGDIHTRNSGQANAFHLAASAGKTEACRVLVVAGYSDFFLKDSEGCSNDLLF